MEKRKVIIGNYDTALEGLWTLSALTLSEPALKTEYISIPGLSGDLDMSTALTDGEPTYNNRTLEFTLESSEGTREERNRKISEMINQLDGFTHNIILPDYPIHYLTGRVSIRVNYSDLVHASVTVSANCEPWFYNLAETRVVVEVAGQEPVYTTLRNQGRKALVPKIEIDGSFDMRIKFGDNQWEVSPGAYTIPGIFLKTGAHPIELTGAGTVIFTYREAVLR